MQNLSDQKFAPSSRSGFTLAEVVVSIGILGFVLTGLLAFFINAVALNGASRDLTVALSHAEYVLEDIKASGFSALPENVKAGVWNWDATRITARRLLPLKNEIVTTTALGKDLLTVIVTVTWQEAAGRTRSITLSTRMGGA